MKLQLHRIGFQALLLAAVTALAACGTAGTPRQTGDTVQATTSLSVSTATPGEIVAVDNSAIAANDVVVVEFRTPAGSAVQFAVQAFGVAVEAGRVRVAAPSVIDAATDEVAQAAVEVGVGGVFAASTLTILEPRSIPESTRGLILLGMLEGAKQQYADLIFNLDAILRDEPSANAADISARIAEAEATHDDICDQIDELRTSGTITQVIDGTPRQLGPAELDELDELLLAAAVGGQAHFEGGGGGAPLSRSTVRRRPYSDIWDEAMQALRDAGIRAPDGNPAADAIDAIRGIYEDTWERGIKKDATGGVAAFTAYIGAIFSGAGVLGDKALAGAATAGGYAFNKFNAFVTYVSGWLTNKNTDQFRNREEGFNGTNEVISQVARLAAEFFANVDDGLINKIAGVFSNAFTAKDTTVAAQETLCMDEQLKSLFCGQSPSQPQNITGLGSASASSSFSSQFSVARGVDGNSSTNWFSNGSTGGDTEVFDWRMPAGVDVDLARLEVDPETFQDGDPTTNDNYGFRGAVVIVYNAAGTPIYNSGGITLLDSRVSIEIVFPAGTSGNRVSLTLLDHEQSDCGGFSELRVYGQPPPP